MLKKLIPAHLILSLFVHSTETNYSANGIDLRSIDASTAAQAGELISNYNQEMTEQFGDNAITINNIVTNQLARKDSGNAWHLQLVYAHESCIGLLAFGKISSSYDNPDHQALHQAFRNITEDKNPMATCVWAFATSVSDDLKSASFNAMVGYARQLTENLSPLPLTAHVPQHLFILTSANDSSTQSLLTKAGLTLRQDDAWTLLYNRPRIAAYAQL